MGAEATYYSSQKLDSCLTGTRASTVQQQQTEVQASSCQTSSSPLVPAGAAGRESGSRSSRKAARLASPKITSPPTLRGTYTRLRSGADGCKGAPQLAASCKFLYCRTAGLADRQQATRRTRSQPSPHRPAFQVERYQSMLPALLPGQLTASMAFSSLPSTNVPLVLPRSVTCKAHRRSKLLVEIGSVNRQDGKAAIQLAQSAPRRRCYHSMQRVFKRLDFAFPRTSDKCSPAWLCTAPRPSYLDAAGRCAAGVSDPHHGVPGGHGWDGHHNVGGGGATNLWDWVRHVAFSRVGAAGSPEKILCLGQPYLKQALLQHDGARQGHRLANVVGLAAAGGCQHQLVAHAQPDAAGPPHGRSHCSSARGGSWVVQSK